MSKERCSPGPGLVGLAWADKTLAEKENDIEILEISPTHKYILIYFYH